MESIKRAFLLVLVMALPMYLWAEENPPNQATKELKQGELLYKQHCYVCHGKPGDTFQRYGPTLSKETMTSEAFARTQIMEGGERMPGFKFGLQPSQINLIIGYLKTVDLR